MVRPCTVGIHEITHTLMATTRTPTSSIAVFPSTRWCHIGLNMCPGYVSTMSVLVHYIRLSLFGLEFKIFRWVHVILNVIGWRGRKIRNIWIFIFLRVAQSIWLHGRPREFTLHVTPWIQWFRPWGRCDLWVVGVRGRARRGLETILAAPETKSQEWL